MLNSRSSSSLIIHFTCAIVARIQVKVKWNIFKVLYGYNFSVRIFQ